MAENPEALPFTEEFIAWHTEQYRCRPSAGNIIDQLKSEAFEAGRQVGIEEMIVERMG